MSRRAFHRLPGLVLQDYVFTVPLDHENPDGDEIEVFAREVRANDAGDLPWLVYFQGGPGSEAPRPTAPDAPTWLQRALRDFRVLLLDQRGTGRSTPVGAESLAGLDPAGQAAYLRNFRADSIVRDAELIRAQLEAHPWSVLGQSFGGFCVTTYLSQAPAGLHEALITGGLPPLEGGADAVYRATYRRVLQKNESFYARYPEDRLRVRALYERLRTEDIRLPGGDPLTVRRFRQLGLELGMSTGRETLHYLLEREIGLPFLREVEGQDASGANPIFALLHEPAYAQGEATRWAAERILAESPEFEDETLFFGEMIFPWMFEEYGALAPFKEAAHLLAEMDDWPALYEVDRLRENVVPTAAAIYANDMYVERTYSEETARTIRGAKVWLTSEYEHNGLRADGGRVLGHLLALTRGGVPE